VVPPLNGAGKVYIYVPNRRMAMTTITPFLWFEGKAEEATAFYASVFKDSKLGRIKRFGDYMPGPKGEVMTGRFTICGQDVGVHEKCTEMITKSAQVSGLSQP
jgi:predicted 3-demethylubiquinone-9 3-methyltransferase (glyoxalase superfamily)